MTDIDTTSAKPRQSLIEIENLTKIYRRIGGATIRPVDDISLTVEAGELVVLLGPSGCGKTTLLRCIAGLEKADTGEIRIDGEVVFSAAKGIFIPAEHRRISMIFQSYALWPHMSVAQNVAYPLESRRTPRREVPDRVKEVLDLVGVGGLGEQFPGRLSGGQQQRVALARALVANTNIVLFDEPLSNVDAQVRTQLRFELKRMQRKIGFAGVYVTHDQAEAMELGHRVVVLESGRIAAMGSPRSVYENPPSAYVANFVGTSNLLDGVVAGKEAGTFLIETALGTILVAGGTKDFSHGAHVQVVMRPETLTISSTRSADGQPAIPVIIEAMSFAGSHTELVVKAGEKLLHVWSQQTLDQEIAEGMQAWLSFTPARLRLLAAEPPIASESDSQ